MKVKWTGIGIRVIQPYLWCQENDFICDVPLWKAAELITYPGGQFQIVDPGEMQAVVSFVEGDSRPIEELKAKGKSKRGPSNRYGRSNKSGRS